MAEYTMIWGGATTSDDRLWATVAHASVFFAPILGPALCFLLFGGQSKFIRYHAVQALLMHFALAVMGAIVFVLSFALAFLTCGATAIISLPGLLVMLVPIYGAYLAWSGRWEGFPGLQDYGR